MGFVNNLRRNVEYEEKAFAEIEWVKKIKQTFEIKLNPTTYFKN